MYEMTAHHESFRLEIVDRKTGDKLEGDQSFIKPQNDYYKVQIEAERLLKKHPHGKAIARTYENFKDTTPYGQYILNENGEMKSHTEEA